MCGGCFEPWSPGALEPRRPFVSAACDTVLGRPRLADGTNDNFKVLLVVSLAKTCRLARRLAGQVMFDEIYSVSVGVGV